MQNHSNKCGSEKTMWVDLQKCFACGKSGHNLPKCGQCSQAYYCGADCQRKNWPKHKRSCKAAVAALARHAHRERLARVVREKDKEKKQQVEGTEEDNFCVICQAEPVDPVEVRMSSLKRQKFYFDTKFTFPIT